MAEWVITRDYLAQSDKDIKSAVGVCGPQFKSKANCIHKFRMIDNDGSIYYHGLCSDDSSFDPLDDFGMPNAGCTEIQYKVNGEWKIL